MRNIGSQKNNAVVGRCMFSVSSPKGSIHNPTWAATEHKPQMIYLPLKHIIASRTNKANERTLCPIVVLRICNLHFIFHVEMVDLSNVMTSSYLTIITKSYPTFWVCLRTILNRLLDDAMSKRSSFPLTANNSFN